MTQKEFEKLNMPDMPGVYFWKQGKEILYIGKATSLRDRVRSYFSNDLIKTRGPRMVDMVFRAQSIEWLTTDSVLEAMIAEANLIKKHWPPYNVREKDDKSFNYVVITKELYPRVLVIRGRTLEVEKQKKAIKIRRSFGPFTSGQALREALKIIRRMFPFIDRQSSTKYSANFYRQIGLSPDTTSEEARSLYNKNIDRIITFFEGKKKKLVRDMEKEMNALAKNLQFEKAAEIKRKIFFLEHIQDVALIKDDVETHHFLKREKDEQISLRIEAYDVAHISGKETVGVMTVVTDGEADKNEYRRFKLDPKTGNNDVANLKEVLCRRLNHAEWRMPDLTVIDGGRAQWNTAREIFLSRNIQTSIVSVVKDERHKPRGFIGDEELVTKHKKAILLANSEAHRFAINYHRKLRRMMNPKRGRF